MSDRTIHEILDRHTVDELINWLRAETRNGYRFLDVSAWRGTTDVPDETPCVAMVQDEDCTVYFHAPSLLGALEYAVQIVDGAGES